MSSPVVEILGELWELPDPALGDRWARCIRPGAHGRQLGDVDIPYHWTSTVTIRSIEARAGEWLMFHAAGLSDADGAVAALIGPSGTGKSTAARTLCRQHFGYVTDETVAVRADNSVAPFPKPISVIPEGGGVKVEFGPDELGLCHAARELRLAGVLLLERQEDLAEPVVESLRLLDGLVALVPHVSALPQLPSALSRLATTVESCGGVHKVTYRDAHQLPDIVSHVVTAPPVPSGFRAHEPGVSSKGFGVSRGDYVEAIELDGQVLVLQDSSCVLLQGIGSIAWLAARQPRSLSDLADSIVAVAGEHQDSDHLVRAAVDELVSHGVLVSR